MSLNKEELHQLIKQNFTSDELQFDIVHYHFYEFSGGTSRRLSNADAYNEYISELIAYCKKNNAFPKLLRAIEKERPSLSWVTQKMWTQLGKSISVFISHALADRDIALRFAGDLKAIGIDTWISYKDIQPGESWMTAIGEGISACDVFLLLMTPDAFKSKGVKREIDIALTLEYEGKIKFQSLLIKQCDIHPAIGPYQYISFLDGYNNGWNKLRETLGK